MKKLSLILLMLTVSANSLADKRVIDFFCRGAKQGYVIKDWSYSGRKGHCIEVGCNYSNKVTKLEKCLLNEPKLGTVSVDHFSSSDPLTGNKADITYTMGSGSGERRMSLSAGQPCFGECSGKDYKTPACRDCLVKRSLQNIYKKEAERKAAIEKAKLPPPCQRCEGENYLITHDLHCYEVGEGKEPKLIKKITTSLCEDNNALRTTFKAAEGFDWQVWLLKFRHECFEIDEKTSGGLFKMSVKKRALCDKEETPEAAVNDSDKNEIKEVSPPPSDTKKAPGSSIQ
jgi:hypothetical protein